MFRLCHHHNYKHLYEYNELTNKFEGAVGQLTNDALDYMSRGMNAMLKNVTLQVQQNFDIGLLDELTNRWTGCIGQLQSNESDMTMQLFKYPMDGEHLRQGLITYETALVIGGMYEPMREGRLVQILDAFSAFTARVWMVCILTVLLLFTLSSLRRRLLLSQRPIKPKRNNYRLYRTLTHCVRIGAMPARGATNKLIFLGASIFALVIVHYFCSSIKTELVVIPEPKVFYSYEDVMERNATPFFIKGMAYDQFFKGRGATPQRKKLWKWAVDTFREDNLYVELTPLLLMLSGSKMLKKEGVMIVDHVVMPLMPGSGCPVVMCDPAKFLDSINLVADFNRLMPFLDAVVHDKEEKQLIINFTRNFPVHLDHVPSFNFHISKDPSETKFAQGIIFSALADDHLISASIKSVRKSIESGHTSRLLDKLQRFNLLQGNLFITEQLGPPIKSRSQLYEECISSTIIKPDVLYHPLTLGNMRTLVSLGGTLLLISLVVLFYECICFAIMRH